MSTVEAINKKLQQDEEWLKQFESNVQRSSQLRNNVEKILTELEERIDQLECNVVPMHETNGRLQIKQQNIQKLIRTIDATVQFYGRSGELESAIRDGSPSLDLGAYLEQMEHLQQAVAFFQAHPNYGTQLENMKLTLESGYVLLEKEYKNVVNANSFPADAQSLVDSLDEQYELITSRAKEVKTVKSAERIAKLGDWLLRRGRSRRFLGAYATIRGEHMLRTLNVVASLAPSKTGAPAAPAGPSAARGFTIVPAKAGPGKKTRFAVDRQPGIREAEGAETETALLVLGAFVALTAIEETVMEKAITDVGVRAQIHRELFKNPLSFVIKIAQKAVQDCEGSLASLLPVLRFVAAHNNQLTTIASNAGLDQSYSAAFRALTLKCSQCLADYADRAAAEAKFAPADGNVHPVTASTLNTLYLLSHYRQVVTNQVLILSAGPNEPPALLMPKLFARMLSSLGQILKTKAEAYDDPTLGAIFALNNSNYIAKALDDESSGLLPVLREQNANILQYYVSAIQKHISDYMASWYPVMQTIAGVDQLHPDDRTAMRNMITAFNREFEQTVAAQRDYCVADPLLAEEVRAKVKAAVMPVYGRLYAKANALTGEQSLSRHLRFTEEMLDVNIDRLFDVAAMPASASVLSWRDAATIIMLSRSTRRVLLLRRGQRAAFMPGAYVFPGGNVNEGETARDAVLRELFEETGVLAYADAPWRTAVDDPRTAKWQDWCNEREAPRDLLKQLLKGSRLATDALVPWSTWLTPNASIYRRRFMTDFFVLPVDGEPEIRPCSREMEQAVWRSPKELLEEAYSGTASVPPPQQYEMRRLQDVDLARLASYRIRKVLFPHLLVPEEVEGVRSVVRVNILPGDQDYIDEPPGIFSQGTRVVPVHKLLAPDRTKPLHRLTYLSDPMYAKCTIDVEGVDPVAMREKRMSRI